MLKKLQRCKRSKMRCKIVSTSTSMMRMVALTAALTQNNFTLMSTNRTYPTERRKAWAYAERMSPNDTAAQEKHFEKKFKELKAAADRHLELRAQGGLGIRNAKSVSFETGKFHHGCSGFAHFNPS